MSNEVDILENDIREQYPDVLETLLLDHTTQQNIFWATDNYHYLGESYTFNSPILPELITGDKGNVIMPRVQKDKDLQQLRVRDMAEVFTPSWICNAQNNMIDNAWFGCENVFNTESTNPDGLNTWIVNPEKITFPEGNTWKHYVRDTRMEMTCGEAPYITSRYDTTTGEFIPIERRIGLLDRKLRVIQFAEYYEYISLFSPKLSKTETLAIFLQDGGIPEYLKQKKISQKQADGFMQSVLHTIVEKDVFTRLKITNKHDFNKILDFVFDSVGSYVSPRSISDTLQTNGTIVDKQTVAKYLDALCDVFLIYKVPRYELKGKGLIQTLNKFYLVDPCFRKIRLRREMVKDRSHWLENAVYLELVRRYRDVFIGKIANLEVDFVVTDNNGYTSYFQVAWTTDNPETLQRELAPLKTIKDSNPKYLLTTDTDFNPVYDGIRKINVIDWLLEAGNYEK